VNALRKSLLLVVMVVLATPAVSDAKPKPKPPPPPPDSAADCGLVVAASVPDYLVLASIDVGVRCATAKRSIAVSSHLTRDGILMPVLPVGSDSRTCSNATECFLSHDLFSLDNHPEPTLGDQVYCATGTGLVGGTVLGPDAACEADARL
jgi:hypothetical protein